MKDWQFYMTQANIMLVCGLVSTSNVGKFIFLLLIIINGISAYGSLKREQ